MISIYVAATHLIPRFSWMENACAPPPSPLFLLGRNCHSNYFQSYQHTHTIKWSASALPHSLCFRLVLLFECRRYCTRGNYVAGTRWASALLRTQRSNSNAPRPPHSRSLHSNYSASADDFKVFISVSIWDNFLWFASIPFVHREAEAVKDAMVCNLRVVGAARDCITTL